MTSDPTSQLPTILILHPSDDLYRANRICYRYVQRVDPKRFYPIVVLPEDMKQVGWLSAELQRSGIELPIAVVRRPASQPIRDQSAAVEIRNTSIR